MSTERITVIGAGLAGCAAAFTAADLGAQVTLVEQRPTPQTAVHVTSLPCELAGYDDFGVEEPDRAAGLLKLELRELCTPILQAAQSSRLAEQTLRVDRNDFARRMRTAIDASAAIELARTEARELPGGPVVVATGPATWSPLAGALHAAAGAYFGFSFIGRAPLIAAEGLDLSDAQWCPPYPGADPALFVPVREERIETFAGRLSEGDREHVPEFDDRVLLADEAIPIERIARDRAELAGTILRGPHGPEVTASGPMLRLDAGDEARSSFHLHGCPTALTAGAQADALRAIEACERAEIVRPGMVQRTPWLPGPQVIRPTLQLERVPRVLLAGTLTGVFGYLEAMATGVAAGLSAAMLAHGVEPGVPPRECLTGALCHAITEQTPDADGRMITANFGMMAAVADADGMPKQQRRARQIEIALDSARAWGKMRPGSEPTDSRG